MRRIANHLILVLLLSPAAFIKADTGMTCWFDRPAASFLDSCPIGNGRLGAMDFDGAEEHRIVFNESSVWSGGYYEGDRPDAAQNLARGRELYFSGDVPAAQDWFARKIQYPDLEWKDGRVTAYRLTSPAPRPVNILINGKLETRTPGRT